MKPDGISLIGFGSGGIGGASFQAYDPTRGVHFEPSFVSATAEDVNRAAQLATAAMPVWTKLSGAQRRRFLHAIADNLEAKASDLIARAALETALPSVRLQGELVRTCGQLRLYGITAERGDWLDARIEIAQPERQPLSKPDHRSMLRPLGPVVVFGASNFPFAYSVAGGDTASAFAAGCPVIVKAHAAHPGTSELVGRLVLHAVRDCGLPEGSFSLLFDAGFQIGQALVKHPLVKAVGFTGSLSGGRALVDLAAARPEPIPVYAEMGSINPFFIFPEALTERRTALLEGLYASATSSVGQFCTNPGLIVLERSTAAEQFVRELADKLNATAAAPMLTAGIQKNFASHTAARGRETNVAPITRARATAANTVAPLWFETEALDFLANPALASEIFGPSSLVVWCKDRGQLLEVARNLAGAITATLHAATGEEAEQRELLDILATKAGRIVLNGYPTGLEVSPAIVHGGPYPATSDGGRSTSVGTRSLVRWTRLICYQNFPDPLLPPELQRSNPLGLRRLVDGEWTEGEVQA